MGIAGLSNSMFMDSKCKTNKRLSDIYFFLVSPDNKLVKPGKNVKDLRNQDAIKSYYTWMQSVYGNAWLTFEGLPKGIYKMYFGVGTYKKTHGKMPFAV